MEQEIARVHDWADRVFPGKNQGYFIGPFVSHYLDDLVGDMGLPRRRTSNIFVEYLAPFWPSRYSNLGDQRRRQRREST